MRTKAEVSKVINGLIIPNISKFDFAYYGDPDRCFLSKAEEEEAIYAEAATKLAMPKYGTEHKMLNRVVAKQLGISRVSYGWLTRAVGRICEAESPAAVEASIKMNVPLVMGIPYVKHP
jgi:hypothetical protein